MQELQTDRKISRRTCTRVDTQTLKPLMYETDNFTTYVIDDE